jgi:hypothetical protein
LTQASSGKRELKKNVGCGVLSCSKQNLPVRKYLFKKIKKEEKYGVTIRLHGSRLKGLDQRRAQPGSSFCLDDDVHRHERDHGKKQNRGFVPDRIYAGAWNGSLDSQTIHPSCKKMDQKIDRLQMQRWAKIYGKVHEPMGQSLQGTCPGQDAQKTKGGEKWIKEQWLVLEKKLTKTQHSCTIGRIVQRMPLKKFSYFAAAEIAANWKKWTKQKSGELSWTSLSSTAKTLLKVEPNLDSSLSGIRGHWPRIFLLQLELRQIVAGAISRKLQATSYKLQASSTRIPDSSNKRQAPSLSKNFFMFEYPWCIGSCFRPPDTRFRIQEPS